MFWLCRQPQCLKVQFHPLSHFLLVHWASWLHSVSFHLPWCISYSFGWPCFVRICNAVFGTKFLVPPCFSFSAAWLCSYPYIPAVSCCLKQNQIVNTIETVSIQFSVVPSALPWDIGYSAMLSEMQLKLNMKMKVQFLFWMRLQ